MNVSDLRPRPKDEVAFRRDQTRHVSRASGCYVLTNILGDVLYVGLASCIAARFEQHLDNPTKVNLTSDGRAVRFFWLETKALEGTERAWQNQFRVVHARLPALNKADSPVSH